MDFYLFNPSSVHLKNNSPYLGEIYCLVTILIMRGLDLRTLCQVLSPNYFLKSMDLAFELKMRLDRIGSSSEDAKKIRNAKSVMQLEQV